MNEAGNGVTISCSTSNEQRLETDVSTVVCPSAAVKSLYCGPPNVY